MRVTGRRPQEPTPPAPLREVEPRGIKLVDILGAKLEEFRQKEEQQKERP